MILDLVLIGVAIALDPLPLKAFLVVLRSSSRRDDSRCPSRRLSGA